MKSFLPEQNKLYIYNKFHQVKKQEKELDFYFFGSSSQGNSVYLKSPRLLIDLGFGMKKYNDVSKIFFYNVNYILLTHEHTDHLNVSTLTKILSLYPHIKFIISQRMYNRITNIMYSTNMPKDIEKRKKIQDSLTTIYKSRFIIITNDGEENPIYLYSDSPTMDQITIIPHIVTHGDITNVAYEIKTNTEHILYSSDLDHVFAPESKDDPTINAGLNLPLNYDSKGNVIPLENQFSIIFLEANYDEELLNKVLKEEPDNAHARGNLRHISEQETWKYLKYALSDDGIFIPLHASSSYGTLIQEL